VNFPEYKDLCGIG